MSKLKIISIIILLVGIFIILNIPIFQNVPAEPIKEHVEVDLKPDYLANITIPAELKIITGVINDRITVPLILHNKGKSSWNSNIKKVFVSYHLKNKNNELLRFDNIRTSLKKEIKSGEQVQLDIIVDTPEKTGQYKLEIDLVKEGSFWFAQKGSSTLTLDFNVETIFNNWKVAEKAFDLEKNTVESDQETSLVHGAWFAANQRGYDWLKTLINGESIINRLDKAIMYLFHHKYDVNTKLITKGHTADWGDVSPDFADQRAVDLHKDSCLVVGIYTQAMLYKAIKQLIIMYNKLGNTTKSEYWLKKSKQIKEQVQKQLWNKKQGFFRVHVHVDCSPHLEFDEDNIFAMGGTQKLF